MAEIRGLRFTKKGGEGSGHHGHTGRPGQIGGSAPGGWRAVPVGQTLTPAQRRAIERDAAKVDREVSAAIPKKGWISASDLAKQTNLRRNEITSQLSLWELQGRVEARYNATLRDYEYSWKK